MGESEAEASNHLAGGATVVANAMQHPYSKFKL